MTFDSLLLSDLLHQHQQHQLPQPTADGMGIWDASKLAEFSHALAGGLPVSQPMHAECFPHGSELAYNAPALSQGYASLPTFPDYQHAAQGLQFPTSMQEVPMQSYPAVSLPQQQVPAAHDAALLQVLQSQLAAASLLASQTQCTQLPLQPPVNNPVNANMDFLAQGQYYDLLNQASLQAVQSVLQQQRLMSTQQVTMLQQLLKQESQAMPKQGKRGNGNQRNMSSGKHRNGSRHGGRKAGVAQQAPSWADGNWDPMSNVHAKRTKEQQGTGVFLPQGLPELANESANDQMSEASSDQSSGCNFDVLGRQES